MRPSAQCAAACTLIGLLGVIAGAAGPTTAPSDEQQIRAAAAAVLDPADPTDPQAVDAILITSDVERRFAVEMLKAMRAERGMFHRAAVAVTADEKSAAVREFDRATDDTRRAVMAGTPVIDGDTATMDFAPAGAGGTQLAFRRVDSRWRFDFLRRYRERGQINDDGIARWESRQRAAEIVARLYERKEERNLGVLPVVYETICDHLAESRARKPAATAPRANK